MIITLGRSKTNGKTAAVIESKDGVVYLNTYKQKNGFSSFDKLVESIELNEQRIKDISEYYNRLKN